MIYFCDKNAVGIMEIVITITNRNSDCFTVPVCLSVQNTQFYLVCDPARPRIHSVVPVVDFGTSRYSFDTTKSPTNISYFNRQQPSDFLPTEGSNLIAGT